MKKGIDLSSILSILSSQAGYVGDNGSEQEGAVAFPYATQAIKQQLAERIYGIENTIPEDYFETYVDYVGLAALVAKHGLVVFGEDNEAEQQVFWFYVMLMRSFMILPFAPDAQKDKDWLIDVLDSLQNRICKTTGQDETWRKLVASAIAYEEKYPYNPNKKIEFKRDRFKKVVEQIGAANPSISLEELLTSLLEQGMMTLDEVEKLAEKWGLPEEEFAKLSSAEFKERMQKEADTIKDIPEVFSQVRERILKGFKGLVEPTSADPASKEDAE